MKCKYIYLQTLQIISKNVFATCYENNNKYLEMEKIYVQCIFLELTLHWIKCRWISIGVFAWSSSREDRAMSVIEIFGKT